MKTKTLVTLAGILAVSVDATLSKKKEKNDCKLHRRDSDMTSLREQLRRSSTLTMFWYQEMMVGSV